MRLLLLARSESWLDSLSKHPSCPQDLAAWLSVPKATESLELPPWTNDHAARLASYRLALDDYAAATGLSTPPNAYVPHLNDRVFDRPLYLHLAALAALEGQRPQGADALLRDQLRREWRYWLGIHGERVADYDDWSDALAYVILCQGTDIDQLRRVLKALGVDAPSLAAALQSSYPATDNRIAALEPDLIAEALLRERLAERRGSALLDAVIGAGTQQIPLTLPVIARLAAKTRDFKPDQIAAWAKVLLDALSRHWPRYRDEWFAVAHRAEPSQSELLLAFWQQLYKLLEVDTRKRLPGRGAGVIKKITDKGFGFVTVDGRDKDIFFHSNSLEGIAFNELHEGDAVTFAIEETAKGQIAVSLQRQ
ncbi:MAG: cold shock domain-containing protein [Acidobacteriia bacterium]|nr:cold shock domain-containing protein [Terriglobia bacterium]